MKFYTRQRRMPSVIIVSLIDILAILLIFVIVTTTFKRSQPEVAIKLPESNSTAASPSSANPIELTISTAGAFLLEGKPVDALSLASGLKRLQAANPTRPVALKADDKAPFGSIVKVLDILKEAGITSAVSAFVEGKQ